MSHILQRLNEKNSRTPFLPEAGKTTFRGFTEKVVRSRYILFVDIIGSKVSPSDVKAEVQSTLKQGGFRAEVTGNGAYMIVVPKWAEVLSVVRLLRSRTSHLGDGFGGFRCSVAFGDTRERTFDNGDLIVMDKEGVPVIPIAAYLNDEISKLIESANVQTSIADWVVVDRLVAEQATGFIEEDKITANGFQPLGQWEKKGVSGVAFGLHIQD